MSKKKIGLALGGGAARGLAHIGVLEALEQSAIPVDMIAGTSMGAIIGAFYSYTGDLPMIREMAIELGKKRLQLFTDIKIPRTGLLSWRKVEKELNKHLGNVRFEDLRIPFACTATDIDTGEEIVIKEGKVWDAIRASASVPVMLPITEIKDRHLIDGGILDPVPVRLVKGMGADIIIAVNVLPALEKPSPKMHNHTVFSILLKTIYIFNNRIIEESLEGADIVIAPDTVEIGYTDFHKAEECIEQGKKAARKSLPKIKRLLRESQSQAVSRGA